MAYIDNIILRDVKVMSKNFSGMEKIYNGRTVNTKGSRNFCPELPENLALQMKEEGWNVKHTNPQDPDEPVRYYIQVALQFRDRYGEPVRPKFRPKVVRVDSHGDHIMLNEETVEELDDDEIIKANIKIRGREYEPGKIKAYAKVLYAWVDEADPFANDFREAEDFPGSDDELDDLPFD